MQQKVSKFSKSNHSLNEQLPIYLSSSHTHTYWQFLVSKKKSVKKTFLELAFSSIFWHFKGVLRNPKYPRISAEPIRIPGKVKNPYPSHPSNPKIVRISGFYPDRINPDANPIPHSFIRTYRVSRWRLPFFMALHAQKTVIFFGVGDRCI